MLAQRRIRILILAIIIPACAFQCLVKTSEAQKSKKQDVTRIIVLEINAGARAEVEIQQRWMEVLSDVGVDRVRSRTSRAMVIPEVKETNMGTTIMIKVTGSISGQHLILPNGKYSLRDKARLKDFFEQLRDDGSTVTMAEKKAFGLTSTQLVSVHQSLSKPLSIPTKGQLATKIAKHIIDQTDIEFVISRNALTALQTDNSTFPDEIQGLSFGTAMAAVVRPMGLVLVPMREQGKPVKLHLVDSREADEHWPVGWPIDKSIRKIVPKLAQREKLSIRDFPIGAAYDAIQKRVAIPFVYDQNSLARGGIDLATTKVTVVRETVSYIVAIQNMARQTKPRMRAELRLDEQGKPFLWLTTANAVR